MIYKLHFPVKVSFVLDNNELQIQDLDDIEYIQDKYDVDLQYIIDEYEYKLEAEENYLEEDEDSFGVNKIDILQSVIDDNIQSISEQINKELELSNLDKNNLVKLFKTTQDDFNGRISLNGHDGEYNINSIEILSYDLPKSSFVIDVDTNRELNESELIHLKSTMDNKCIEEWGSDFESIDHSDILEEDMYVYLKCVDNENVIDFIN